MKKIFYFLLIFIIFSFTIYSEESLDIVIVYDTVDDWSTMTKEGIKSTLNSYYDNKNTKVVYHEFDTELKKEKAEEILDYICKSNFEYIFTLNYPDAFADLNISVKLDKSKYKIISMNPVAVEAGVIDSYEKPGSNITGVGVFLQMRSLVKLMKRVNPDYKSFAFFTWDRMTLLNKWFRKELELAAKEEGLVMEEFAELSSSEEEFGFFKRYNGREDLFIIGGISVFVNSKGELVNMTELEPKYIRENMKTMFVSYDETNISRGVGFGASVIWEDIGAQLAEKGIEIINGKSPADIEWSYPRKYNIVLNMKRINELSVNLNETVIGAAYRIYTDYEGNYLGQEK